MGYHADTTGVDFIIPEENLTAAFEALKELDKRDELKSGFAYGTLPDGSYGKTETYFAWMPADWVSQFPTVGRVLAELGFDVSSEKGGGDLEIYGYSAKTGDERHFLEALAPFVKPGSYLEWEGEDRERWRWDFDGQAMTQTTGRIIWD